MIILKKHKILYDHTKNVVSKFTNHEFFYIIRTTSKFVSYPHNVPYYKIIKTSKINKIKTVNKNSQFTIEVMLVWLNEQLGCFSVMTILNRKKVVISHDTESPIDDDQPGGRSSVLCDLLVSHILKLKTQIHSNECHSKHFHSLLLRITHKFCICDLFKCHFKCDYTF